VWESSGTGRVAGGVDSMLWFRLERGGDMTKCCRKMKRVSLAGGEVPLERGKGGDDVWAEANLTGPKMKKIHAVDSAGTNGR
jgi:hypothetical protein